MSNKRDNRVRGERWQPRPGLPLLGAGSLDPAAISAAGEATKQLEALGQKVAKATRRAGGLFVPQRDDRIEAHGAPRRDVAG